METNHKHLNIVRQPVSNRTKIKRFVYFSKGTCIKNKDTISRIEKLGIPPAYNNVVISNRPRHYLQAIGEDNKGRKQYIYNDTFLEKRDENKFTNLILFSKKIEMIRNNINAKLRNNDNVHSKDKIIALVLYIVEHCNFRIGNEFYANKYKTYGTTTLQNKHLTLNGNKLHFKFVGKKGVVNECWIDNRHVVELMSKLMKDSKDYIFEYDDMDNKRQLITANDVNEYLKTYDENLTVKMYRTWKANYIFLQELIKFYKNVDKKEVNRVDAKKNAMDILKKIAFMLHNTPEVSKKSYMNNGILELYLRNPIKFYILLQQKKKQGIDKLLVELLESQTNQ